MIRLIADVHTHTIVSGHAYGTIREMAQAAAEQGMQILACTEHGPHTPGTCDPIYFNNLWTIPRVLYGVHILHGCELNVMNDWDMGLKEKSLEKLDFAIAGVHPICYEDRGREENTENVAFYMRHPKVRFVSHPDDDTTALDYPRLVQTAGETHTALEVNNSSFQKGDRRINYLENYRTMLRLCRAQGVPIVVNTDAHDPSRVGRFDEALAFVEAEGFPPELILNTDADRLMRFLTEDY